MCWPWEHRWETVETHEIVDDYSDKVGKMFILRCLNCGNVKSKKMRT